MANTQKTFALVLGIVLLLVGVWGLFLGPDGNILSIGVNVPQSVLHVIGGIFGIYVGTKGMGPGYNSSIGWIGIVLAVLGFVPYTAKLLDTLLNVNMATTWLHLVIGVVALGVYYSADK
ncbi:MAG: DUF4383 domain-containing protein [Nanoarchaeota archaeon]|nr:DUF4383 domain-containing protein [Nanoarchaeota archaeon]